MRRARNAEFYIENGKVYGINLGADSTAEHEWGIKKLNKMFGVGDVKKGIFARNKPVLGVDLRTITKYPEECLYYGIITINNKEYTYLICYSYDLGEITEDRLKNFELYPNSFRENQSIFTSWDEGSFGILVDETYKESLAELYEAFKRKDIMFAIGASEVFRNGGLLLVVRSEMSKEEIDNLYEKDLDYFNLQKAAEDTGIKKILKEAGKGFYALSPRWKDEGKTEVIFWLNPYEQNVHNFGWFTVDELKQWANNEGPVMKKK